MSSSAGPNASGSDGDQLAQDLEHVFAELGQLVEKEDTMVREADAMKSELLHLNERTGPVFKMALDPADIARSIVFALDQPPHVQIAEMLILPVNRY